MPSFNEYYTPEDNLEALADIEQIDCSVKEASVDVSYCYACLFPLVKYPGEESHDAVLLCQLSNASGIGQKTATALPTERLNKPEKQINLKDAADPQIVVQNLPKAMRDEALKFIDKFGGDLLLLGSNPEKDLIWVPQGLYFGYSWGHAHKPSFTGGVTELEAEGYQFDTKTKKWSVDYDSLLQQVVEKDILDA